MPDNHRPLGYDLFTGLHGWSEGLVAEGWRVIGFDIEDMCAQFGQARPEHVELRICDVLTINGAELADANLIVASPPCQEFSYMAMPWTKAKAKAKAIRADTSGKMLADLTRLFDACFRIQREAYAAAGRHIPMIVENVRGAQPWVGRSRWHYGSFHLWGDVPALMPIAVKAGNLGSGLDWSKHGTPGYAEGPGRCFRDSAIKNPGHLNQRDGHTHARHLTNPSEHIKHGGDWFGGSLGEISSSSSKSNARKMASAIIAKIPLPLSRHIGCVFYPASMR